MKPKKISMAEFKRRVSSGLRKKWKDKRYRAGVVSGMKKVWKQKGYRGKMSRAIKLKYAKDPSYRLKTSRAMKKVFKEHPNLAVNLQKSLINFALKNPKFIKKLLNSKGNPNKPDTRTLRGDYVRSKPEAKVADGLYANKIEYGYEKKAIIFKKLYRFAIPDFWLPKYNMFIEVLGGYPGSEAKGRWKRKMYKRYKIRCIFLTSKQIIDLKKNMFDKLK